MMGRSKSCDPDEVMSMTTRSRRQILTRAMDLLPVQMVRKWSDTAWVVGEEMSTPRRLPRE